MREKPEFNDQQKRGVHALPCVELIGNSGHDWQHWLDVSERLQWVNLAVERIAGFTPDECFAMGEDYPLHFIHPDDRHLFRANLHEVLNSRSSSCTRFRILTKTQEVRWIEACCQCVREAGTDAILGFHGVMRDVTTEKEARRQLRESQERLDLVLWSTRQGYWDWNIATRDLHYNERLAEMLGMPLSGENMEAPKADWWLERIHADDREAVRDKFMRHLDNETLEFEAEARFARPSGACFWVECRGCVVERGPSGEPLRFVGTIVDISDRKLNETRHKKLEQQLRHAMKMESLGIMAGGIAHDFNNLLMAIMGNAQLLHDAIDSQSPLREGLGQILDASNRAADLSRQMLAYSGKGLMIKRQLDLNELVDGLREMAYSVVGEKTPLHFELSEDTIPLEADPAQLQDVLRNLLTNAAEACADTPGQVTVRTSVRNCSAEDLESRYLFEPLPAGRYAMLEVVDTGQGIPEAALDKIFDPFYSTKFVGRGLGLAVVMGIALGHDGLVQVESRHGEGSTFRLLLPIVDTPCGAESKSSIETGALERPQAHVLLIEDDDHVRDVCKALLEHMGYTVSTAAGGYAGADVLEANPSAFDCVVLDFSMPDLDGTRTFHLLKKIRPDLPVVIASGHSEADILSDFLPGELAGFLQKPFHHEHIDKILTEIIGKAPS